MSVKNLELALDTAVSHLHEQLLNLRAPLCCAAEELLKGTRQDSKFISDLLL